MANFPTETKPTFVGEAEAYALLARAGLCPPRHGVTSGELPFDAGEPVVVKGLGEKVWHKSELGAVRFMMFDAILVAGAAAQMRTRLEAAGHRWIDGLVCEKIKIARSEHLPTEAFASLSRGEAGWTVLFGFGGLQAEALAELSPPLRWPLAFTTVAAAMHELEGHLLGRIWLGRVRGTTPLTTRVKLAEFLVALWQLAKVAESEELTLLEMNPFALDLAGQPRPLDAVGTRGTMPAPRLAPPTGFLAALRAPRRIALAGVSATEGGVGRTIIDNLRRYPLPTGDLLLIKPGQTEFLGLPCVSDVSALREHAVDLLMLSLPAAIAAKTLTQLIAQGGGARCVALVAGGIGDGADHDGLGALLAALLHEARAAGRWTPAILGPNFLGHWVPARQLDTSFIPTDKLAAPLSTGGELTLLSQSGAFLLCRRSKLPQLRFGLGIALGNQMDVALCDVLAALASENGADVSAGRASRPGEPLQPTESRLTGTVRPTCQTTGPVACYVEGFGPGQLLAAARAIKLLTAKGRRVLIHRAGRTAAGQAAAASHTGAMASDLVLERALLERAGALFIDRIADFDAALAWLSAYPHLAAGPVALLTNAGFESVNGSDLFGPKLPTATLDAAAQQSLRALLEKHELSGLVAARLPLDLTPMADDAAFLEAAEFLLEHSAVLVIGLVPFTRRLSTTSEGAGKLAKALLRLRETHDKPIAVVVDAGPEYAGFVHALQAAGLPVFGRVESALLGLRALS